MSDWLQDLMNGTGDAQEIEIPKDLGEVTRLAEALIERQQNVKTAEAKLKEEKEQLLYIQQNRLPEVLQALGLSELKLENGHKITLKDFINVSIPKDERYPEALDWLRENDHGDIIKNEIKFVFGKEQDKLAYDFMQFVRGWNQLSEVNVINDEKVHPQTLNKFAKDMLQQGVTLPETLFSVFQGSKAEIK